MFDQYSLCSFNDAFALQLTLTNPWRSQTLQKLTLVNTAFSSAHWHALWATRTSCNFHSFVTKTAEVNFPLYPFNWYFGEVLVYAHTNPWSRELYACFFRSSIFVLISYRFKSLRFALSMRVFQRSSQLLRFFFPGVFFIPYCITLVCVGVPMMVIDFANGQMTGGALGYWLFCPLFRGIRLLSFLINLYSITYYVFMTAWWIFYLILSLQPSLPWASCRPPWATPSEFSLKFKKKEMTKFAVNHA